MDCSAGIVRLAEKVEIRCAMLIGKVPWIVNNEI